MAQEAIRLREAATGQWHTVGAHTRMNVRPASPRPASDQGGSATLSFTLTREVDRPWPDLSAYEEVEYEINGIVVWEGRIKETPSNLSSGVATVTIQCVGWQAHLDNDAYAAVYAISDITQFKDIRSFPGVSLGWAENKFAAHGEVGSSSNRPGLAAGAVTLGWAKGEAMTKGELVGIALDLGPNYPFRLEAINMEWFWTAGGFGGIAAGQMLLYVYGQTEVGWEKEGKFLSPTQKFITGYQMGFNGGSPQAFAAKLQAVHNGGFYRYLHVVVKCNESSTSALVEDVQFSLTMCEVFAEQRFLGTLQYNNYESASNLRASDVVIEAVKVAAPKLIAQPASPAWSAEVWADFVIDYWSFGGTKAPEDEGSGANNIPRNLTDVVAPVYGQPSLLSDDTSTGAKFDGSTQYCSTTPGPVPASNGWLGVSIEAIVKPESTTGKRVIWAQSGMGQFILEAGQPQIIFQTSGGAIAFNAAKVLSTNAPAHLVATYNVITGIGTIFINGVAFASGSVGAGSVLTGNAEPFTVGATAAASNFWSGIIQKLVVFPVPLTVSQVEQHYKAALAREYGTVQRSQFKIRAYDPTTSRTPHQHIDAVDAVQLWRKKVLIGRKLLYAPQASIVHLEASPTIEFQDAAANSADLIYSKAIIEGQNAASEPIRLIKTAGELYRATAFAVAPSILQLANPGGESAPVEPEWNPLKEGAKTIISQDTAHVLVGTHSIKWGEKKELGYCPRWPTSTVWRPGRVYRLRVALFATVEEEVRVYWGEKGGGFLSGTSSLLTMSGDPFQNIKLKPNAWNVIELIWIPLYELNEVGMSFTKESAVTPIWIDGIVVEEIQASAPERNGYHNTKVLGAQSNIDAATTEAIANAFLQSNSVSPFRGQFSAAKVGDVRRMPGGQPLHPSELLLSGGELIRIPRINPDTGDLGRDGKVATVSYDGEKEEAVVTVDDDRQNFQALMNRMAAVQGGIS